MKSKNLTCRPIYAVMAASLVMLTSGLTYRGFSARLMGKLPIAPIARDSLEKLPRKISDWVGEDIPMDEAIVRATDTDAHVNRRYARSGSMESVMVFVGCSFSTYDRAIHRPEICYPRSGWTLVDERCIDLQLLDEKNLPCTVFRFSRGSLEIERTTVLHYYIVDGEPYANVSILQPRLWRLRGKVNYVARVLITIPDRGLARDTAERIVSDFAIDSASPIARLFEDIENNHGSEPVAHENP